MNTKGEENEEKNAETKQDSKFKRKHLTIIASHIEWKFSFFFSYFLTSSTFSIFVSKDRK